MTFVVMRGAGFREGPGLDAAHRYAALRPDRDDAGGRCTIPDIGFASFSLGISIIREE
jgi:hypothetical protein